MIRWFRSPIEIDIIVDALNNDPDRWEVYYNDLKYPPLGIVIPWATDAFHRLIEGHLVTRNDVPIRGTRRNWRLGRAIVRWLRRRDDQALRRLIEDDHTQRVKRIAEMKIALARDEAAHIQNLLR